MSCPNTSSTGVCGRRLTARSTLNDSRLEHSPAPVNILPIQYNQRCSSKRPRTVATAGGMAHEERAS